MDLFVNVFMQGGWARVLPLYAQAPLYAIAGNNGATRDEIHADLLERAETPGGLASAAWDPLHQWTDDELQELEDQYGNLDAPEAPTTAADLRAAEAATREARIADLARYAQHLGIPPIRTIADLLDLMALTEVLLLNDGVFTINPNAPLPAEVLPLSAEAAAAEDDIRWRNVHGALTSSVVSLFHPDSLARANELRSTLSDVARETDSDPESIRAAITALTSEGDFTASADVERLTADEIFTLTVDWDLFARTRIGVKFANPEA
jgi:hypothetical protein